MSAANPYGFGPGRLAEFDQWHAARSRLVDDLIEKARADIANGDRVGRSEEAALLTGALRGSPATSVEFLCDLLAVLLVRVVRPVTEADPQ